MGQAGARLARIDLCDTCLQLSQEAQMVLADPETPRQVIHVADQLVCDPLQPGLKVKVQFKTLDMLHSLSILPDIQLVEISVLPD